MAWEARGGKQFYYRAKRAGTHVLKVYLGCGAAACQAAERDAAAKAKRTANKVELATWQSQLTEADRVLAEVQQGVNLLAEAELLVAGFHQHKGEWRRRQMIIYHGDDDKEYEVRISHRNGQMMERLVPLRKKRKDMERRQPTKKAKAAKPDTKPADKPPAKATVTPLEAILILARRGRKEVLPQLRKRLDESPELWQHFGNLARQSQENWLRLVSGKDLYLVESLRRHLDEMRSQLAGPNANALERLLVDRMLACHVQVLYFEAVEGQQLNSDNPKADQFRMQRQDQAHRQFLAAAKTLATVRQLMSRTVVFGVVQQQPPAPSVPDFIPGLNVCEEPATATSTAASMKTMTTNRLSKSTGSVNRINATEARAAVMAGKG